MQIKPSEAHSPHVTSNFAPTLCRRNPNADVHLYANAWIWVAECHQTVESRDAHEKFWNLHVQVQVLLRYRFHLI